MLKRTRISAALISAVLITGAMPVSQTAAEETALTTPSLTISKPVAQTAYQNTTTVRLDFTDIETGDATAPKSITALYNADKELESVALGDVTNGKASYAFDVPADVADYTVKSFVWDMENLEPVAGELELTESEFESMIPAATWDFEGENTADISSMTALSETDENGKRVTLYLEKGQWGIGFRQQNTTIYEVPEQTALSSITSKQLTYPNGQAHWGAEQASEGSSNCISVSPTGNWRTTGMKVYLTNEQIEPGKKYSMTFYVKNNGVNSSNQGIARDIYATLVPRGSAISWDGKSESDVSKIVTELPMWQDCYRTSQPGATWIGCSNIAENIADRDAVTVGTWQKQEIILEPEAADFNVYGVTGLYLAFTVNGDWNTLTAGEAFYVDDVRITEIKETPAMEWDFEDDSDISTGSELNKWTYVAGSKNDKIYVPKVANDATLGNYMQLSTNGDTQWPRYLGTKVKLSKEQLEVGKTYKLTAKVKGFGDAGIYAHLGLTPYGEKTLKTCYNAVGNTYGENLPFAWLTYGEHDFYISHTTLGTLTYKFTPTADDFDDNGYANLWIMLTPNAETYAEGKYNTIRYTNTFGFDDIKIEPVLTEE